MQEPAAKSITFAQFNKPLDSRTLQCTAPTRAHDRHIVGGALNPRPLDAGDSAGPIIWPGSGSLTADVSCGNLSVAGNGPV
jgi:hypothetical protein